VDIPLHLPKQAMGAAIGGGKKNKNAKMPCSRFVLFIFH
jgi:hypothetical protein